MNAFTEPSIAFACLHRVAPFLAWRFEVIEFGKLVERHQLGLLGDADGPLPLDIGVAAKRGHAGPRFADIAAHQEQVAKHMDVLGPMPVLRQAHAVIADDRRSLAIDIRHMLEIGARDARTHLDLFPGCAAQIRFERVEAMRVFFDEDRVEHARRAALPRRVVERENGFRNAGRGGDAAAAAELEEIAGHLGASAWRKHFHRVLRILETLQAALRQWIERDDGYAALARVLDRVKQSRRGHTGGRRRASGHNG